MFPVHWPRLLVAASLALAAAAVSAQQITTAPTPDVNPAQRALSHAAAADLLLEGNPAIRIARHAVDAAGADVRRADVSPNPMVTAAVSNTLAGQYRSRESDRVLRVEQLLERGDKRALRTDGARLLADAARQDLLDTVRQQRLALAETYGGLVAAQRLEVISRQNLAGYRRLVEAAERRLRVGDLAAVDVARLRVEAARAAQDARAAEADTAVARIALAAILGVPDQAQALRATEELPTPDHAASIRLPTPRDGIEAAVERRPDTVAARARLAAAARARQLAASQRTRDLLVGVQAERAPSFGGSVFGVSVSIPLLTGNDFSGDIARAEADDALARESLQRSRALVRVEVERATVRLTAARERAALSTAQALPEARRAAEGVEFAFARGAAPLTDLFDARRQLAAVEAESTRALSELWVATEAYRQTLSLPEVQ